MLASIAFMVFFFFSLIFIYGRVRRKVISLSPLEILLAFGCKVLMGCLYGYVFQRFYGGDDTWILHAGSIDEYNKLMTRPGQFFADFDLTASFRRNEGFAAGWYYLLSDLEFWTITKPLAIFNMYSRGNYYVNVVFFNLLTFWGQYLVFKLFTARFPHHRRLIFLLTFFLPAACFWLSGLRPDAWIMVSMGVALYYFHAWLHGNKTKHLLLFLAGLAGLVILRSPVLLVLIPGLAAWLIAEKTGRKPLPVFLIVYGAAVALVFGSAYLSPNMNMLTYIVHRQQEFLQLKGNTVFELNALEPTAGSFIATLPQAFVNTFLRPYPWEASGALQWMASMETMLILVLIAAAFVYGRNQGWTTSPLVWLSIFFGLGLYLFIGYTVPFPGAIVRYKTIPELLFILAISMRMRTHRKNI